MAALKDSDKDKHEAVCTSLRSSPFSVEQGENDNLIISKLDKNPTSLGIFGFSYLDAYKDTIKPVPVPGVAPTSAPLADGTYPGSSHDRRVGLQVVFTFRSRCLPSLFK